MTTKYWVQRTRNIWFIIPTIIRNFIDSISRDLPLCRGKPITISCGQRKCEFTVHHIMMDWVPLKDFLYNMPKERRRDICYVDGSEAKLDDYFYHPVTDTSQDLSINKHTFLIKKNENPSKIYPLWKLINIDLEDNNQDDMQVNFKEAFKIKVELDSILINYGSKFIEKRDNSVSDNNISPVKSLRSPIEERKIRRKLKEFVLVLRNLADNNPLVYENVEKKFGKNSESLKKFKKIRNLSNSYRHDGVEQIDHQIPLLCKNVSETVHLPYNIFGGLRLAEKIIVNFKDRNDVEYTYIYTIGETLLGELYKIHLETSVSSTSTSTYSTSTASTSSTSTSTT